MKKTISTIIYIICFPLLFFLPIAAVGISAVFGIIPFIISVLIFGLVLISFGRLNYDWGVKR